MLLTPPFQLTNEIDCRLHFTDRGGMEPDSLSRTRVRPGRILIPAHAFSQAIGKPWPKHMNQRRKRAKKDKKDCANNRVEPIQHLVFYPLLLLKNDRFWNPYGISRQ